MYAHIITYRHSSSDEVVREINDPDNIISDQSARAIASWYQSPNDNSKNLTALSSGKPFDTQELLEEIESEVMNQNNPTDEHNLDDFDYGSALIVWTWSLEMILEG